MDVPAPSAFFSAEVVVLLTRKGQVTIPAAIRRRLGFQPEGKVSLVINQDTQALEVRAARYPTVASLAGAAGVLSQKTPLKEMLEVVHADASVKQHA